VLNPQQGVALGAVQLTREIAQHHTGRRQRLTGIDQQGFVIGVGSDEVDGAGFTWGVFGNNRLEVVIEGAVGGVVEFLDSAVS
jgi:hypothetical protein